MQKVTKLIFCAAVLLVLVLLAVLTLFFPQTVPGEYDVWENRTLAEQPVLQTQTLFDGSYFTSVESYLSDHLFGRQTLLTANVRYQQLRGSVAVNGVVCSDDILLLDNGIYDRFGATCQQDAETMAQRLSVIRDATEQNGGTFLFVGIPTQRNIFEREYPSFASSDRVRTEDILSCFVPALEKENIPALFLEDTFREINAPLDTLYSPIDHHFTLKGANLCVRAAIDCLNESGVDIPQVVEDRLVFEALPNPMLGTYNRKLYGCTEATDSLLTYNLPHEVPYERWDNGVQTDAPLIVLPQTETEYVQYSAYMGGDKAETIVKTNRPELKKLLVVGDSFTNAMETVLYLSFDEMRSLDFRYYTEKALTEYIAAYQPDVVLVIRDASVYLNLDGNGNLK